MECCSSKKNAYIYIYTCIPYAFLVLHPQFPNAGVGPPGPKDALAPSNAPDFLEQAKSIV